MAKNTILVYTDLMEQLDELSMEERGVILTAMIKYQLGEELPELDKTLKLVFIPIRQSIDRDNDAYVRKCEKNRENINKRWNTVEYERIRSDTNHTDNDNENDKENDNDKDSGSGSGNENDNAQPPQPPLSDQDVMRIAKAWNEQDCTRHISGLTENRRKLIMECGDINVFIDTINSLDRQQYLVDQSRSGKSVTFDWFCQPENYRKVLEGNYKESYSRGGGISGLERNW